MDESRQRSTALRLTATLHEAISTLAASPVHSGLSAIGTVLGAAAAIAALGVSATSQSQVDRVFDIYAQTQVTVVADDEEATRFPAAEARFEQLPGVVAATTLAHVRQGASSSDGEEGTQHEATVLAVGPSAVAALELEGWTGRPIDPGFHLRGDPVAVVGAGVATDLGLTAPYGTQVVFIAGEPVTVIGVFSASPREPQVAQAVLVSRSWADRTTLDIDAQKLVVRVEVGAVGPIAERAPAVVDPYDSTRVIASAPPTAEVLRAQVASQVGLLVLVMAGGALVVGSIGISNTASVGVLRRTGELSLRRALGATRHDLARLVLLEGAALGLAAGVVGAVLGLLLVVVVSWVAGWTPLVAVPWLLAVSIGAAILGAVFSAYPAYRASSIEPATGLRQL